MFPLGGAKPRLDKQLAISLLDLVSTNKLGPEYSHVVFVGVHDRRVSRNCDIVASVELQRLLPCLQQKHLLAVASSHGVKCRRSLLVPSLRSHVCLLKCSSVLYDFNGVDASSNANQRLALAVHLQECLLIPNNMFAGVTLVALSLSFNSKFFFFPSVYPLFFVSHSDDRHNELPLFWGSFSFFLASPFLIIVRMVFVIF